MACNLYVPGHRNGGLCVFIADLLAAAAHKARETALLSCFAAMMICGPVQPALAASAGPEIAVSLSLTGAGSVSGQETLEGIRMAVDEANAASKASPVTLTFYDDKGSDQDARVNAVQIAASRALLVLGPSFSTAVMAAGPVYADAHLGCLPPTATADLITSNATTFLVNVRNSDVGRDLAVYLSRILGQSRAAVIYADNGYGNTLRSGFEQLAAKNGLKAVYIPFRATNEAEADAIAKRVAGDPDHPAVVLLTGIEGERLLVQLRRAGLAGPFVASDAFGDEAVAQHMASLPEERDAPGFFTRNLYAVTPVLLDSANDAMLNFVERFRARYGHSPGWRAAVGYDVAAQAVETVGSPEVRAGGGIAGQRQAAFDHLLALNSVENASPGLFGPFWFDAHRSRQLGVRIGRFTQGHFESAPMQIVPVLSPRPGEIADGAVFQLDEGHYVRVQRVIYTGVFLNEIQRIDLPRSSFTADFYLWMRYAGGAGAGKADPTDITFGTVLTGGAFDRTRTSEQFTAPDGMEYRLWRVRGEFRNDYDLKNFPFDRQTLSIPFFNARSDMDHIVYVVDQRSGTPNGTGPEAKSLAEKSEGGRFDHIASASAFRNISQWQVIRAYSRRENLVSESSLGDPFRVEPGSHRELSGFLVNIELRRLALATSVKSLLPLFLMTLIMYAALYFPAALVKEKVAVAITGALSGAVLMNAINAQLGSVGYTVTAEYGFYVFFGLSLLCIVSVLVAERKRATGKTDGAAKVERLTRRAYLATVVLSAMVVVALHFANT